jgi:SAM-dependent methyltransferase
MGALARLQLGGLAHTETSAAQAQTRDAFGFQWKLRGAYESDAVHDHTRRWLMAKYCQGDPNRLAGWLSEGGRRQLILDAGCGAGLSALALFGDLLREHDYLGVDISDACEVARTRFQERGIPADFLQCSLMDLPIPDHSMDIIFSEGVLHHTDNTREAFQALTRKLAPGGRFLFYVYARKAVLREFADDHVRAALRDLDQEAAWEALKPLTRLGQALGRLDVTFEVPEDIPFLGIRKGSYDLQRFFYWHILKAYYRPDWTLDELNHINFDWYRPENCHRHTSEEVEGWVQEAGLHLEVMTVEEAGITVVARKS